MENTRRNFTMVGAVLDRGPVTKPPIGSGPADFSTAILIAAFRLMPKLHFLPAAAGKPASYPQLP